MTIECESSRKYLRVRIDENLTWRDHIYICNWKKAKNFELLYQGKNYLDENSLTQINFAYIHAYLNYADIAWTSSYKTKLKTVQSKQKHALRIIFNHSKTSPCEPFFLNLNVLNVYQIIIFQSVQFMYKIKNKDTPDIFLKLFDVPCHPYPTNFSLINFSVPGTFLKATRFAVSVRCPILCNNCLSKNEKVIDNFLLFRQRAKERIMEESTAANFFQ